MTRKNGIDLFRLIGAFFIMCLHTTYGNLNQDVVDSLRLCSRWAVPFFFIATGYFMGSKIVKNELDFGRIQKNVSGLISILLISSLMYLPLNAMKGNTEMSVASLLTGGYIHLWFIGSLLTGYIVIWYLHFIKRDKLIPYLSGILLLLALFTDSYDQVVHQDLSFGAFRFLMGVPFMYAGIMLSKNKVPSGSYLALIALVITGFFLQYVEAEFFFRVYEYAKLAHQLLIGTVLIAIPLFILSAKLKLRNNLLSDWGQKYSLFIYLYHPLIYAMLWVVLAKLIPSHYESVRMFSPIIGFALALSLSVALDKFFPKVYGVLNGNW